MMVGLIEMMNFCFQLLDSAPVMSSGQFKTPGRGWRCAINRKVVEQRRESKANEDEKSPNPFAPPDSVNEHPQAEQRHQWEPGIGQPVLDIDQVGNQRSEHGRKLDQAGRTGNEIALANRKSRLVFGIFVA